MSVTDIYEKKFREVFDETCDFLMDRKRSDPSFTLVSLRNTLENLYIQQGNDWEGRGELFEASTNATISAYEHVWAIWKRELEERA